MKKLTWNKDYETNIEAIDAQHRKIVSLLNALVDSYDTESRHTMETESIIEEFSEYITFHFNMEEYYASKYKFPNYDALAKEHDILRNMFNSFRYYYSLYTRQEKSSTVMIKYLDIVIVEWFQTHFCGVDREFAEYIKEKNVEII